MNDAPRVEKLRRDHPVENFDCGREELNRYLVRYAFVLLKDVRKIVAE
jgi:hypothetical protein